MSSGFKFNFPATAGDESCDEARAVEQVMTGSYQPIDSEIIKRGGKEIFKCDNHFDIANRHQQECKYLTFRISSDKVIRDELVIYYVPIPTLTELSQKDGNILEKINQHSTDLLPGEYEGGFKIWECSRDLVGHLFESDGIFKDTTVLELGCGAGLPGMFCLLQGASVHFQDYNEEVVNMSTISNVILNAKLNSKININPCRFFSGEWSSIQTVFSKQDIAKYDYVLASETIYNPDSYESFHSLLKSCLKKTGMVFIAAKVCYFGVGGSVDLFKQFVISKGCFKIDKCKVFEEGVKREIFTLTFV